MARTTTTRTSKRSAATPASSKRPGRPTGSKNKATTKTKARAVSTATRRAAPKQPVAPATPKMSKADLELHVVKLERSIARLRKQNAELKQAARGDVEKTLPTAKPSARIAVAKPKRSAAPKTRRQPGKVAEQTSTPQDHENDTDELADA